jgi:hypothetical protein
MVNFQRLLHSKVGIIFISILLGLGLATLFRKVCKDKTCIEFNGPILAEVSGKTYKHGEKCYQYHLEASSCKMDKKTIDFKKKEEDDAPKLLGK